MKQNEIKKIVNVIVYNYDCYNYKTLLNELALKNELTVLIFSLNTEGNQAIILYKAGKMPIYDINPLMISDFLVHLGSLNDVNYISTDDFDNLSLSYGAVRNVDNEDIFFYVNTSIEPGDSSIIVLKNQLLIITAICLFLAVILSYFIAKKLSSPIEQLNQAAKNLANGNFDIQFKAEGFDELSELAKTLNYATGELKNKDQMQKDLIANVSHELRTPLTIIKAYSELIRDISGDNKEKREQHLSVILQESDRLKNLVNDILDLSKLQSGAAEYKMKDFNLSECVIRVYNIFNNLFKEQGFVFNSDIDDNIMIIGDENRIEQVVYNLIANAVNYSIDRKDILIRLKKESVDYAKSN
jgi:signal transduction histidine kinase